MKKFIYDKNKGARSLNSISGLNSLKMVLWQSWMRLIS